MGARTPALLRLGCAALLLGYALALFRHTSFAVGGSDSSGYLNGARLLSEGRVTEPIQGLATLGLPDDFGPVFVPLGSTPIGRPRLMAPSYPPGLPLHMALAGTLGGFERGPFFVSPLAGVVSLLLLYLLALELGLPRGWAVGACAVLAFFPTFVSFSLQPMSDVVATAWAIAAMYAALRSRRPDSAFWAAITGAAYGVGILVRPTNALVLVPLAFALPWRWRSWLFFILGGVPAAVFQLAYNAALFGSPWSTGYGGILAGGMAWSHFAERARHYGIWVTRLFTPLVPIGWLALAYDRRAPLRTRAVLLSWFAVFFLFYCFYGPYEAWWYTRFLLPGIPALVLGAALAARDLVFSGRSLRRARVRSAAAVLLLAAILFTELRFVDKNRVHEIGKGERIYPDACRMAQRRVPPNAIVLSMQMSGALHYYTDVTFAMWNWLDSERFERLRVSTESRGHRWYALLAPFETEQVWKNLSADWRAIDRVGDVVLWERGASPLPP